MGQFLDQSKGMLSGLVGPVVFVKGSNGTTYIRSKPSPSHIPPTAKKQQTWDRFALMTRFTAPLYPFLKESFTDLLGKKSSRDAIRGYYLAQVIVAEDQNLHIAYDKVLISTGRVRSYEPVSHTRVGQHLNLTWQVNTRQPFAAADDLLSLIAYAPETEDFSLFKACATREAGSLSLDLPEALAHTPLEVYTTFSNAAATTYAYSTYLGRLV